MPNFSSFRRKRSESEAKKTSSQWPADRSVPHTVTTCSYAGPEKTSRMPAFSSFFPSMLSSSSRSPSPPPVAVRRQSSTTPFSPATSATRDSVITKHSPKSPDTFFYSPTLSSHSWSSQTSESAWCNSPALPNNIPLPTLPEPSAPTAAARTEVMRWVAPWEGHDPAECSDGTCSVADPPPGVDSDKLPTRGEVDAAGDVPIYDEHGGTRPFRSLYQGPLAIGEQQLVIFMRHFFCGSCQAYIEALDQLLDFNTYFTLPKATNIVIIGLGKPDLIPHVKDITGTRFRVFADPTRRLHRLLGMSWTVNIGMHRPSYYKENEVLWLADQLKQMATHEDRSAAVNGGKWWWIGGEYLYRDGKLIWCHRMRNYRDHAEMDEIRKLLQVDECLER